MRVLAIDTSGRACSIALFENGRLIADRHEEIGRGHAEALIPWIADLPDGGRAELILVGTGPGSFTGVRVGIAAALGLGLGWGAEVCGMSSLALIAQGTDQSGPFLVAVEGGHGELFVQPFIGDPLQEAGALQSLQPDAVEKAFPGLPAFGICTEKLANAQAPKMSSRAAFALDLPKQLRNLPATPVYGRDADARPLAR